MTLAAVVLAANIDAIFHDYTGSVPGASVVVIRNGEVIARKAFGLADLEKQTPVTPETNFRLASVSKQFTAMAILTLVQHGKLSLDQKITTFFPEFPEFGITVRQLLTHTSGLVDYEDVIPEGTSIPLKDFDVLWLLQQQTKTVFAPGSQWRYSNGGYALLALIVEKVSGQTYPRFLHDNLFAPAGMKNTLAYEKGVSTVPNRAYGYRVAAGFSPPNPWRRTDQSLTSAVLGDGGIYSSVDDLTRWYAWLDKNPLYADASSPHAKTPDASYGYGWYVGEKRGRRAIWHDGESISFRNFVLRLPADGLTVIILTNRHDGDPLELALDVTDSLQQH